MAISVSIETLEDGEVLGGPWAVRNTVHSPISFVQAMNADKGVFLADVGFIPLGRITSLWFGEPETD